MVRRWVVLMCLSELACSSVAPGTAAPLPWNDAGMAKGDASTASEDVPGTPEDEAVLGADVVSPGGEHVPASVDAGTVTTDVPMTRDVPATSVDPCAGATAVTGGPDPTGVVRLSGTTATAPLVGGLTAPMDCVAAGRFGRQVIYTYRMRTTAVLEARTDNADTTANLDTIVVLADRCDARATIFGCNDDIARSEFRSAVRSAQPIPAGTTVTIAVGAYTPPYDASYTDSASFELRVREVSASCAPCQYNDQCVGGVCLVYGNVSPPAWCSSRCTTDTDCGDARLSRCVNNICALTSRGTSCSADRRALIDSDSCGGMRTTPCASPQTCSVVNGVAACRMPGSCSGSPSICSGRSTSSCSTVRGCFVSNGCEGSPQSCGSFYGSASCRAQDGCEYQGLYPRGDCRGSATSCRYFSGESRCDRQTGCRWSSRCDGTPAACATLTNQTDCATQGCTWR